MWSPRRRLRPNGANWPNGGSDLLATAEDGRVRSAIEVIPPTLPNGEVGTIGDLVLHQYFLSLFGLNIGELWDLKALSAQCKKLGRYTFLLTSIPLHVPNGIGSPPNALAIF